MPSTSLVLTRKYSLYETLLFKVFNQLPLGSLELELPDGHVLYFGNGNEVKARIRVINNDFFSKSVWYGDIGFAESYMDGDWYTDNISDVISWFIINLNYNPILTGKGVRKYAINFARLFNNLYHKARKNTIAGSKKNICEHYDLGNDFYKLFLDKTMTYSSAIFQHADQSLEDAQTEKYDRLCRQISLKPTDHILEIGSGWGGFAVHAAKNYGCKVTTVTISDEQFKYAKARFEKEGLQDQVEIRLQDYRTLEGTFDNIVSIEMLEAVGHEFLPVYFAKVNELLKSNGSIALQVITSGEKRYNEFRKDVDFIQKHIFPGSQTPSISAIQDAINKVSDLNLFDAKDIGLHYAKTLKLWSDSFNQKLEEVKKLGMDDKFIRKWNYYLHYCESAFRLRHVSVMQLVYTRPNNTSI
ncbi:MAG: class I SAM-dependent methyltransferase [Cyclobacteriaceae bacterium]|nr:class I SAM-dependent methyltransferase [Cyclobacteriaceae bacterium]